MSMIFNLWIINTQKSVTLEHKFFLRRQLLQHDCATFFIFDMCSHIGPILKTSGAFTSVHMTWKHQHP